MIVVEFSEFDHTKIELTSRPAQQIENSRFPFANAATNQIKKRRRFCNDAVIAQAPGDLGSGGGGGGGGEAGGGGGDDMNDPFIIKRTQTGRT